jgi:hypothetical protein
MAGAFFLRGVAVEAQTSAQSRAALNDVIADLAPAGEPVETVLGSAKAAGARA